MIYRVVTGIVVEGKNREAWEWLVKAVTYVNEHYPDQNSQILRNMNGPSNQGHWVGRFESLAVMEEFNLKLSEDTEYQEDLEVGVKLWKDFESNFYRVVP